MSIHSILTHLKIGSNACGFIQLLFGLLSIVLTYIVLIIKIYSNQYEAKISVCSEEYSNKFHVATRKNAKQ